MEFVWKCRLCNTVLGRVADGTKPTRCTNPNCPSNRNPGGHNNLFHQHSPPVPPGAMFPPGGPPNGQQMPPRLAEQPPPGGGQRPNAVPPVQPIAGNGNARMPQLFLPNPGHEEAGEEDGSSTLLVVTLVAGFVLLTAGGALVLLKFLAHA
jgi:hypothetical protein